MEQPIYYWDPIIGPSGMTFYNGNLFPQWKGSLFVGGHGTRDLVRLTLDGAPQPEEFFVTNIAVGNGRFHGGGMHPCPRAVMNDGLLEVTTIDHLGMFELLRDLPVLYSDDIYKHPKVRHFRARRIRAESDEVTRIEVDGEALGTLPLEIEVLPKQLSILVAPESPLGTTGPAAV